MEKYPRVSFTFPSQSVAFCCCRPIELLGDKSIRQEFAVELLLGKSMRYIEKTVSIYPAVRSLQGD